LEELRVRLERRNFDPEDDEPKLTAVYGKSEDDCWERTPLFFYRYWSNVSRLPDRIRKQGNYPSPDVCKKMFLLELAEGRKRLEHYQKRTGFHRVQSDQAGKASAECPRLPALRHLAAIRGEPGAHLRAHSEPARTGSADAPWPAGTTPDRRECFFIIGWTPARPDRQAFSKTARRCDLTPQMRPPIGCATRGIQFKPDTCSAARANKSQCLSGNPAYQAFEHRQAPDRCKFGQWCIHLAPGSDSRHLQGLSLS
jgi:hypothetical protein